MGRMQTVTITNMCMVYDGNRVLVQDKCGNDWNGITFPGGHVEQNESFTDAVIREVKEETGLTVRAPRLCGIKDWVNADGSRYMVLCYKTAQFTGTLCSSREGEVFWADLDELPRMKCTPDFADMLKVFLEEDLSEFWFYRQDGDWEHELK